jgi:glycosyltransferase involved in cell wall biosynthesis
LCAFIGWDRLFCAATEGKDSALSRSPAPTAARIALLTPLASPSIGGNATTVARIARSLRERGVEVRVWDVSATPESEVEREAVQYSPTLIHAFHAFRTGPLAKRMARGLEVPLLVTITGTDANRDLIEPAAAPIVRRVLEYATGITVFHDSIAMKIIAIVPDVAPRIFVIPQSVVFEDPGGPWPPAGTIQRTSGPVLLFPAGIRKVKQPRFPLEPLEQLLPRYPALELLYVGPIIEREEGDKLFRLLVSRPWARHVGTIGHDRMPQLLESSDVVLNCSLSEGGMANSVLEALAMGRAVLAADIEGNRSVIEDGVTGFLFGTPEEFGAKAARLLADPALRRRVGEAGCEYLHSRFSPAQEVEGYLAAYGRLVPTLRWGQRRLVTRHASGFTAISPRDERLADLG